MNKANINLIVDGKNKKSFLLYLSKHPKERLWQAIRNWSGYDFVLGSNNWDSEMLNERWLKKHKDFNIEDTFYN